VGLDTVEIVLKVEDSFQITLNDSELSQASTVGELHQLVMKEFGGAKGSEGPVADPGVCLGSRAFYVVRREFTKLLKISRSEFRPCTEIAPLVPWNHRREMWRQMEEDTQLSFPKLDHLGWVVLSSFLIPTAACIALFGLRTVPLSVSTVLWSVILIVFTAGGILHLTRQFKVALPSENRTAGSLARSLLAFNHQKLNGQRSLNSDEALETIRRIIAVQMQIELEEIRPESHFTRDIGIE
jgi:acyl carrier protein